ncbi:MAG: orotidine-5'-phosphate decarboxylase [Chitinophagaceae bacterium]|nr:orotidine-5'-phosphate decarboxylase [Chitinophagaceae bacterium]
MNRKELIAQIRSKKSVLCVGLDTDLDKIPKHLLQEPDPLFAFNKAIIDATKDYAVSYKINTAFYEAYGVQGWQSMAKTLAYIPKNIFTIADAKRGDIGNTSTQYAKTFFETYDYDSVTIAPYMGKDSVAPFLQFAGKWGIVLGITSNEGSLDFQHLIIDGKPLYEHVLHKVSSWGSPDNIMFVVGATRKEQLAHVRSICPDHFFLIPGVGAQGGDVATVCQNTLNKDAGILINVSRGVIYASTGQDFAERAGQAAADYQKEMALYL